MNFSLKKHRGIWHVRIFGDGHDTLRSLKIKTTAEKGSGAEVLTAAHRRFAEYLTKSGRRSKAQRIWPKTFGEIADLFCARHVEREIKAPKKAMVQIKPVREFFGAFRPWAIDSELIARYEDGRRQKIQGITLNREKQWFRAILKWGARQRPPLLEGSECEAIISQLQFDDESRNVRNRALTGEEVKRLVFCPGKRHLHGTIAILMASVTMMRLGEILRAKWADVQWDRRRIFLGETKNGRQRFAPLAIDFQNGSVDLALLHILNAWRLYQADIHARHGWPPPEYLLTFRGCPLKRMRAAIDQAIEGSGLMDVRFHDLRHFATTRFYLLGHLREHIKQGSGHLTDSAFRRYLDLQDGVESLVGLSARKIEPIVPFRQFLTRFPVLEKYRFTPLPSASKLMAAAG